MPTWPGALCFQPAFERCAPSPNPSFSATVRGGPTRGLHWGRRIPMIPVGDGMPTKIDINWLWSGTWEAAVLIFRNLWWIFIPSVAALAFRVALNAYQHSQDARAGFPQIDAMTGVRFEEWLANFFRARGYAVRLTPRTGDYGVDLEMRRDGEFTVVQAKCWKGNVGLKAVQEVFSGKALYKADAALVVTNSYFTYEARRLAKSTGVALWDRARLKGEILGDQKRAPSILSKSSGTPANSRR